MNEKSKANLSILLAVIGPLVFFVGGLSAIGDPSPSATPSQIVQAQWTMRISLTLGLVFIAGSIWLSGSAFSSAPRRSLGALVLCTGSFIALVLFG